MKKLIIPLELAQAIGNYLSKQPWSDVNPLLVELAKLPELKEPEGKEKQDKK